MAYWRNRKSLHFLCVWSIITNYSKLLWRSTINHKNEYWSEPLMLWKNCFISTTPPLIKVLISRQMFWFCDIIAYKWGLGQELIRPIQNSKPIHNPDDFLPNQRVPGTVLGQQLTARDVHTLTVWGRIMGGHESIRDRRKSRKVALDDLTRPHMFTCSNQMWLVHVSRYAVPAHSLLQALQRCRQVELASMTWYSSCKAQFKCAD